MFQFFLLHFNIVIMNTILTTEYIKNKVQNNYLTQNITNYLGGLANNIDSKFLYFVHLINIFIFYSK